MKKVDLMTEQTARELDLYGTVNGHLKIDTHGGIESSCTSDETMKRISNLFYKMFNKTTLDEVQEALKEKFPERFI